MKTKSLSNLIFWVVILTVAAASIRNISDLDVWWHLASGRWMWEHHHFLRTDPFSFTVFGHRWIDHEWFFQIVLYAAYRCLGIPGILFLKALLLGISVAGVYRSLPQKLPVSVRSGAVLLLFYAIHFRNMARADLVSMACFPWFFHYAMNIFKRQPSNTKPLSGKELGFLGLLAWLVANSHAGGFWLMWTTSLIMAGLWMYSGSRAWGRNPFIWLSGWLLVVGLANPYGIHLFESTVRTLILLWKGDGSRFYEYQKTSYEGYELYWFLVAQAWALYGFKVWKTRRMDLPSFVWLFWATCMGHTFLRNLPFSLFILMPVSLQLMIELTSQRKPVEINLEKGLTAAVCLALLAWALKGIQPGIGTENYPVQAADFISQHLPPGPGFNDYIFGGYLIWRFYEQGYPVFIDGRMHAIEGYRDLWRVVDVARNYGPHTLDAWRFLTTRWPVGYALIALPLRRAYVQGKPVSVFAYYFPHREWALVYLDKGVAVYVRRTPAYADTIRRYEIRNVYPDVDTPAPITSLEWKSMFPPAVRPTS